MKTLIVQIKCELGHAYDVAAYIIDNVTPCHIYSISGSYDLLALINLDDDVDVGLFVNQRLHKVPGIKDTSTVIAFNAFTPSGQTP